MAKRNIDALRKKAVKRTKAAVSEKYTGRDMLVVQAIRAFEDVERVYNELTMRAREWYGVYFPELNRSIASHDTWVDLVSEVKFRKDFVEKNLIGIDEQSVVDTIVSSAAGSMGGDLDKVDVEASVNFVKLCKSLLAEMNRLDKYVESIMTVVAPNLSAVAGYKLGAKLLAHSGSLRKLALLPSSTVQIMGAEKALFKHIKKGKPGPKHGLIFQHTLISGSPKDKRGKFARLLAAKISLAAKKDFFSEGKDDSSKELLAELKKRAKVIREKK